MTDPRIGDTVHYRRHLDTTSAPSHCLAAIITGHDNTGGLILRVLSVFSEAGDYTAFPEYDTNGAHIDADKNTSPNPAGFTPGTWHHIH